MSTELETSIGRRLGLTQEDVEKLGAFGVVWEAVRLFGSLHPSLVWIFFTLVLPFTVYQQLIVLTLSLNVPPPPALPTASWNDLVNLGPHNGLGTYLGLAAFLFTLSICFSLVIPAAVFYSVGSIYNGRNVTFSQVMHAVPRLWRRLSATAVVLILLVSSVAVVFVFVQQIFRFTFPGTPLLLIVILAVLCWIPLFIILLIYQVAIGVTCFEEDYGMSALRKAKHILHNKWGSALLLNVLLAIPSLIYQVLLPSPLKLPHEFHWTWLLLMIFLTIINSFISEFFMIALAIFYFSCAANHEKHESINHDEQLEAGYQPITKAVI